MLLIYADGVRSGEFSLAKATNSLGSQIMTTLKGQTSAAATADLEASQPSTNSTSTQTHRAKGDPCQWHHRHSP